MGNLGDVDFMYLNENQLIGPIPDEMAGLLDAVRCEVGSLRFRACPYSIGILFHLPTNSTG